MPDATKRILTDETGQDIVSALETLCTLVDPNGTAVAAAEKINNMTISVSGIAAGSSPTASVSEVDGHKHIALGIPVELPVVSSQDNGKVMMVKNGAWDSDMMDNATSETAGLMSAEDKQKLDGIEEIEIYQEIESDSNSVSFSDGAEAPLKELVIDIEPKQDLHGYDKPWVGGAGKNKLDETSPMRGCYTQGGVFLTDGTYPQNYISYKLTLPAGTYMFSTDLADCFVVRYFISDARTEVQRATQTVSFTLSAEAEVRFSLRNTSTSSIASVTPNSMIEVGSTATAFEPFANLCPISGYDTVNIFNNGILKPDSVQLGVYVNSQGQIATSLTEYNDTKLNLTDYFDVTAGKSYTIKADTILRTGKNNTVAFSWFNGTTFLGRSAETKDANGTRYTYTATVPDNANRCRVNFFTSNLSTVVITETGVPAEFPIAVSLATNGNQTAGTVYGGTITLDENGEGKLVVDTVVYDISTLPLAQHSTSKFMFYCEVPGTKVGIQDSNHFKCSAFVTDNRTSFTFANAANLADNKAYRNSSADSVYFKSTLYNSGSAQDFKDAMAGQTVTFELATPVTYTLTANQVQTLLGYNYIYTDGAEISLTYVRDTSGLMTTADKIKLNSYPTKLSQFTNDAGYLTSVPVMVGATSSADGTEGLVPAPATTDVDKFLSGDGTYKSGGLPMVILSYGNSTWSDFINAYHNNVIVYCRASSNANPASGKQTRMAFMAYVNDSDNPTQVEFQYYRSMNPTNKTISQMSDQVFVYTLSSNGTWSVISREASIKSIVFDASSGLTGTYDKNTGTLTISAAT